MKKLYFLFFLLNSLQNVSIAQTDTIYITGQGHQSIRDSSYRDGYYKFIINSKVESEGNILNKRQEGIWTYYYTNGALNSQIEHHTFDSITTYSGIYKTYYPSGKIYEEGTYSFYTGDSIYCSNCVVHDYTNSKSTPVQWVKYIGSIQSGVWTEYYENGKVKSTGQYAPVLVYKHQMVFTKGSNEKKIGNLYVTTWTRGFAEDKIWKYYTESGKLEKTITYENGKIISEKRF